MREFINSGRWEYNEKQVIEKGTSKSFTLTDPVDLFKEDYYTIRRATAVENCKADEVPEDMFHVYEFLYMTNGCKLNVKIVDFEIAYEFILQNLWFFVQGLGNKVMESFFESEE